MFETIRRLYFKTGSRLLVANAVRKGWITKEQYHLITGLNFDEPEESITTLEEPNGPAMSETTETLTETEEEKINSESALIEE